MVKRLPRRFEPGATTKVAYRRAIDWIHGVLKLVHSSRRPLILFVILVAAVSAGIWTLINYWDWLQTEIVNGAAGTESGSTTARNVGFVVAGLVALPLAIWRLRVAQRQADTAQQDLLNKRYQEGAEMLGSEVLPVRLAGIYGLQRLAEDHPEQFHIQIMQLFCAFACHPTTYEDSKITSARTTEGLRLRADVQIVMRAISTCHRNQHQLEKAHEFMLDLKYADLQHAELWRTSLSEANFWMANLSHATFFKADLSGTVLSEADLSDTDLAHTDLSYANMSDSHLSDADLSRARLHGTYLSGALLKGANISGAVLSKCGCGVASFGLTQAQLNEARADSKNPPTIEGLVDPETDEPLVWRGQASDLARRTP